MRQSFGRLTSVLCLLACFVIAAGLILPAAAEDAEQPPATVQEVIRMIVDWAVKGEALLGASHLTDLTFPDKRCVSRYFSDSPSDFIYVSVGGSRPYPGEAYPTWKYFLEDHYLVPLDSEAAFVFDRDIRAADYVPGPWLLLTVDEPDPNGAIRVTFRYGHTDGSLRMGYSDGRLSIEQIYVGLDADDHEK